MINICEQVMLRPFVWGVNDCVSSAADVFLRIWDVDPIAEIRGRWKTRREAERLLDELGGWQIGPEFLFRAAGLVRSERCGSIGVIGGKCPGLAIKASPKLWLGKTMRGMGVMTNREVWGSWCLM